MNRTEFIDRLIFAADAARNLAVSLDFVPDTLPEKMVYTLSEYDNPQGSRGPKGTLKFLGGRFLKPAELKRLDASRAGSLLWVDGLVPAWVNIHVVSFSKSETELLLRFSDNLLKADVESLYPDINMEPGNPYIPFRLRGPSEEEWLRRNGSLINRLLCKLKRLRPLFPF